MIKTISVLKDTLKKFEKNNINYCILRNYQFILENKIYEGKDIDTLIFSRDLNKVHRILKNQGFGMVPINPYSMHRGYAKYIKQDKKLLQFHFHINGVTGRNVRYLEARDILKRKIKKQFFYVPSNEDSFLVILLHVLLGLKKFKDKYKKELTRLSKLNLDRAYIEKKLSELFTNKQVEEIMTSLLKQDFKQLEISRSKIRKYFEKKKMFKIWNVYLKGALWKLPRLFKKAPLISLIGMDGVGKTTATRNLKKIFEENNIDYSIIYTGRGRENILPVQFFGKRYKRIEERIEKKRRTRKTPIWKNIIYTLSSPIFALDQLIRYIARIWPKRKTKRVVITDRYSTDILLMANVPMCFKIILHSFFPKPTQTIYLWNKPSILHKRKLDHPLEDLERQKKIFSDINKTIKPIAIKTENIKQTTEDIAEIIFNQIFE